MPLQHAVLALLADRPSHGYELRSQFEDMVGPQWGLNVGHLYQVLDRLNRDGLIAAETIPQERRPDRTVFHITAQGRTELRAWLAAPVVRPHGYRDDYFLKLITSARQGHDQLARLIRAQRAQYLQELRSLTDAKAIAGDDPLTSLLIDAAILHTLANLQLVELTEQRAEPLLARARAAQAAAAGSSASGDQAAGAPAS